MENISRILATYLLNACWQLPAIAVLTWICSWATRRTPSQFRHLVWVVALVLGALLPLASIGRSTAETPGVQLAPPQAPSASLAGNNQGTETKFWFGMQTHRWILTPTPRLVLILGAGYGVFLVYRLARLVWALQYTMRTRRGAYRRAMSRPLRDVFERCCSSFLADEITVLCSDHIRGPVALQFWKPILVLPQRFFEEIPEQDFASAVCHEMAHLSRHDFLWNLVYEFLYLPIAFHPAAVLIRRRTDQTRELACDERAAEVLASPAQYADSLLNLARSIAEKPYSASSTYALGLFDTNTMETRIMNLLSKTKHTSKRVGRILAGVTSILLLAACFAAATFSLQIVRAANPSEVQPFIGTWEGNFQGHAFVVLKLREKNGRLNGTVIHAESLSENEQGDLTRVSDKNVPGTIVEANITGTSMVFTIADDADPSDKVSFEFRITGPGQAEMNPVQPQNMVRTKPWKMIRSGGQ